MDITNTIDIDAPINTTWQVLGEEFGEVSGWADPVAASSLDGPLGEGVTRTCDIKGIGPIAAGEVTEMLSEFNRQKKVLTYVIETGKPPFLTHMQNRWTLERRDAASSVANSTLNYRLKWWAIPFAPLIAIMMKKALKPVFAQFRDAVQARYQADLGGARPALSQVV
jgi:hypothetical protein